MTSASSISVSSGEWVSTSNAEEIAARLRGLKRVAVVTHAKPDGDAVGSALSVVRSLRRLNIEAKAFFVGPVPRWLAEVAGETPYGVFEGGAAVSSLGFEADVIVIVDTGSWGQLAEMRGVVEPRRETNVLVDHHMHGEPATAGTRLIVNTAASATQVLAPVCCYLLNIATAASLPRDVAEMLYLGLATDTGWFRYSNVSASTMRLGGDLLEAGIDHTRLFRLIEQQETAGRLKLIGRAMSSLELVNDGTAALISLSVKDFDEAGADRNDTAGFADMALAISTVKVAASLTEQPPPPLSPAGNTARVVTKISFRSKPGDGAVDVNVLAQRFGGGGHVRAAGAKFEGTMEEAKKAIVEALKAQKI